MENRSPSRHHRLVWLALAVFGTLLLLPATRSLLRTQLKMEALTYATETNLPAERAAAASLPDDYPVQLAAATPPLPPNGMGTDPNMARALACTRHIAALTQRFPNNPSLYANLLRYMTVGEVHMQREQGSVGPGFLVDQIISPSLAEALKRFDAAAQRGAQLDPDNAYFPMIRSVGLFTANRDSEALEALKATARCSRWTEYYQDEVEGRNHLQRIAYGEHGAMQHLSNAFYVRLSHDAQLRNAVRVGMRLAAAAELAGHTAETLSIRHAMMHCGGLMRAQGTAYSTCLTGIAITNMATYNPGGVPYPGDFASGRTRSESSEQRAEQHRKLYFAYLESRGNTQEMTWAKTELAAGVKAKSLVTEWSPNSLLERHTLSLNHWWLVNIVLLSTVLVLLALGLSASLAGSARPKKALKIGRLMYVLLVVGGIGLWQWQATWSGRSLYYESQILFSGEGDWYAEHAGIALPLQYQLVGASLLVPILFVGLLGAMALFQRVPLATGLGRGLRGLAFPAAALVFLLYGASLLPTAYFESITDTEISGTVFNGPHYYAALNHKVWPGNPQP
jgi:hypothetical protein